MKLSDENIAKISAHFNDKPVLKAYLFGSQIVEKASDESDVDILIELDYSQPIGLLFIQMQIELEDVLKKR